MTLREFFVGNPRVKLKFYSDTHKYFLEDKQIPNASDLAKVCQDSFPLILWSAKCAAEKFDDLIEPGKPIDEIQKKEIFQQIKTAHRNTLEKAGDNFRLLYDTKGRFTLQPIKKAESSYKLCRVTKVGTTKKKVPYIVTHDARTIRYPDPLIKVMDTVKVDVNTGKIIDFVKYELGNMVMCTKGRNTGRIGVLNHRERHPGSFDIVQVTDAAGNTFATRGGNVFIIGKGNKAMVSLPKGNGVRMTILQETTARLEKQK